MRIFIIATLLFQITFNSSAQLYNTGLIFDDAKYDASWVKPLSKRLEPSNLPNSFSLKSFCPRPGNQLQMNSSAAWATTWSALGILKAQQNDITGADAIASECFSPAFVMAHIKSPGDTECQKDLDLFDALNCIFTQPLMLHRDINTFCPDRKELSTSGKKSYPVIGGFTHIFNEDMSPAERIIAIKKSVSIGNPVVIGMYCPPSFQHAKQYWQPAEYEHGEFPGQALCVVGYDDTKYGGAFEVINSWGSRWGNEGFIWIRYDDFVQFVKYAYDLFLIGGSHGRQIISGSAQLRLNSEKEVTLQLQANGNYLASTSMKTGTFFRIYLKKTSPAFVYVFGADSANEYFRIFPHQDNVSPAIVNTGEETAIPGEDNYIQLTGNPGNENLCILYSLEPLDITQLLRRLKQLSGDITENISLLTDSKVMKPSDVTWAQNELLFNADLPADKKMVFVQIGIQHQ